MGLATDHFVCEFEGSTIELIRNGWTKRLILLIDGHEAARTTCHLPRTITLTGTLTRDGKTREVTARSVPRYLIFTKDTIEVDGVEQQTRRIR
jgi:hypothetical protein